MAGSWIGGAKLNASKGTVLLVPYNRRPCGE